MVVAVEIHLMEKLQQFLAQQDFSVVMLLIDSVSVLFIELHLIL